MNDKIRLITREFSLEVNARHWLNSPQYTALNELNKIDIDSLPENLQNEILFIKSRISNEEYKQTINVKDLYQLELYKDSMLVITFNPNVVTNRNLFADKQLTYADIDKCFDMVHADLCEKGIIVDLKAAPIMRKDFSFDMPLPFQYENIIPIYSLINPTKTKFRNCTKRIEKGTLYLGNSSSVICAYDKMKEFNHKAKKAKSELMFEPLARFEFRYLKIAKSKRKTWYDYNEESFNKERANVKRLILESIFHNEEKTATLSKFSALNILKALIKKEKISNILKIIGIYAIAFEQGEIGLNLLQYLNISSYDSSNYQKVNRLNLELKNVKPIDSNLIEIYNELHELFKRVA